MIINPYKTDSLVREALKKGITRMIVSDIEEVVKIQKYMKFYSEIISP